MTTPSTCKGILRRAINCVFPCKLGVFPNQGEGGRGLLIPSSLFPTKCLSLLGVEQAWTPILYLTDLLCKSLALPRDLSTYLVIISFEPSARQAIPGKGEGHQLPLSHTFANHICCWKKLLLFAICWNLELLVCCPIFWTYQSNTNSELIPLSIITEITLTFHN